MMPSIPSLSSSMMNHSSARVLQVLAAKTEENPSPKEDEKSVKKEQTSEEKTPVLSDKEVKKKLDTVLNMVQKNELKQLDLTLGHFGRFYTQAEPFFAFRSDNQFGYMRLTLFSNDILASSGGPENNTIKLWNLSSRSLIGTLTGHTSHIDTLITIPNSCLLVSGSWDKTIRFWDITSRVCIAILRGHTSRVAALATCTNGLLASGSGGRERAIKLWDITTYTCIATLFGHTGPISALVAVPNNDVLASGSWDKTIRLWNVNSHICIAILRGHLGAIGALVAIPSNDMLASGSGADGPDDGTIRLWNITSFTCMAILRKNHTHSGVLALALLSNGLLVSGDSDYAIRLWDPSSQSFMATLSHGGYITTALVAHSNGLLIHGASNYAIKLLEPKTVSLSVQLLYPILTALQTNTSVSYLDLSGNAQISDDILDPLTEIFKPGFWSSLWSQRQPNTTLKAINLQNTGVTKKCIRELQKVTFSHSFPIDIYSDEDWIWGMICFLLSFYRANHNSSIVDSGLDLCVGGEFGRFFGIPRGWFTRSKPKSNPVPIPRKNCSCSIQ